MSLLEVEDLSVAYGPIAALNDVSIEVEEAECVTVLGANGAGKTTLLKSLSRLIPSRGGSVRLTGVDVLDLPAERLVQLGVAHVPEGRRCFPLMSVDENLRLGAYVRRDLTQVGADMKAVFELFPRLRERKAQHAGTLSGGEQQMLAIGRALMARPRLLMLDEPSMGIAPVLVEQIYERIAAIRARGTAILLVEQNAALALDIADRGYVLEVGAVVARASAAELRDDPRVREAYLGG